MLINPKKGQRISGQDIPSVSGVALRTVKTGLSVFWAFRRRKQVPNVVFFLNSPTALNAAEWIKMAK